MPRFSILMLPVLCVLLAGCVTFRAGAPAGAVDVIAHRGASHDAPENTLAAFELAHDMGADWFELDCHLTRDGEVVVIHDAKLERTTGVDALVAEVDLEFLRGLEAGAWKSLNFAGEPLPTLAEALDFARNTIGVYVEIKNSADDGALMAQILDRAADMPVMTPEGAAWIMRVIEESDTRNLELTRKTIGLIRERGMERDIVIQSFAPIICAIARIEAPEMRVELLSGVKPDEHDTWEQVSRWVFLLDLHGLNLNHEGLTAGRLAAMQQAGRSVAVWTVNDPAGMDRFARLGVDAIITDRPDVALRVLRRQPVRQSRPLSR